MEKLRDYLKNNRLIMDGAMSTYYAEITGDTSSLVECANITHPEIIKKIHQEYIAAGARLIRTNTFAINTAAMGIDADEQKRLLRIAYDIAAESSCETVYIAGDIGPIGETSDNEDTIEEEYKRICDVFIECGADAIRFETFPDMYHLIPVLEYVRNKSDIFIMVDFSLNKNGFTSSGVSAARLLDKVSEITQIDACGFNCGIGSGHMNTILQGLSFPEDKLISCLPNAGYPEQMQNRMVFMDNVNYFCGNMEQIAGLGVDIIGGCCGTRPQYIRKLADNIGNARTHKVNVTKTRKKANAGKPHPSRFLELFKEDYKVVAVELDPPYDADYEKLVEQTHFLKQHGVDIITMADSPMGRSRVDSILMSLKIAQETGMNVMPHVCCRDKNVIALRSALLGAYIHGIRELLLVTGDPVPSVSRTAVTGVFDYNSIRLMNFVKEMNEEHFAKEPFYYGGALNVTLGRLDKIMERMQKKIDAGASWFMTQPVFTEEAKERLRTIHEQLNVKIMCGIMPLVSYRNANFIKNEFIGIDVPDDIVARYSPDMSKEDAQNTGIQIANEIIADVSPYVDGFYFMLPFNRVSMMDKIIVNN